MSEPQKETNAQREDRLDREAVKATLAKGGAPFPFDDAMRRLGL